MASVKYNFSPEDLSVYRHFYAVRTTSPSLKAEDLVNQPMVIFLGETHGEQAHITKNAGLINAIYENVADPSRCQLVLEKDDLAFTNWYSQRISSSLVSRKMIWDQGNKTLDTFSSSILLLAAGARFLFYMSECLKDDGLGHALQKIAQFNLDNYRNGEAPSLNFSFEQKLLELKKCRVGRCEEITPHIRTIAKRWLKDVENWMDTYDSHLVKTLKERNIELGALVLRLWAQGFTTICVVGGFGHYIPFPHTAASVNALFEMLNQANCPHTVLQAPIIQIDGVDQPEFKQVPFFIPQTYKQALEAEKQHRVDARTLERELGEKYFSSRTFSGESLITDVMRCWSSVQAILKDNELPTRKHLSCLGSF